MTAPGGGRGLATDAEVMAATSKKVADVNAQVQSMLSSLRNKLSAVQGQWNGAAFTAFASVTAQWDSETKKLNDALQAISENIATNGTSYSQAQSDHVTALTHAAGGLNW